MSNNQTNDRAKLDLNFGEDDEVATKAEVSKKVEKISSEVGFNSRVSDVTEEKPQRADRRLRSRTGRTHALTTKIKPETYDKISQMSDRLTEEEGRYVPLAEIIERAVDEFQSNG